MWQNKMFDGVLVLCKFLVYKNKKYLLKVINY